MWLVRIALKRPYTFVVMALVIVILGGFTIGRTPTDIFPEIDIPVISTVFNYGGLAPEEMERRIVTNYERTVTTLMSGDSDPVITKKPEGAYSFAVYEAMKK